jgi:signal transduction histidine kinase/ActR/RegA family two-component response regulator
MVLFGVTAAVTAAVSAWTLDHNLTQENHSKGIALAESIANSAVENIGDPEAIQGLLDRTMDMGIVGVTYLFVTDVQGEVIAHTFAPAVPRICYEIPAGRERPIAQWLQFSPDQDCLDIAAPILAGQLGQVHVGMDGALIRASTRAAVLQQSRLIGLLFLVGAMASYLLMNRVVRPLGQLTRQVRCLASSAGAAEPTAHPELLAITRRSDEIGELAGAFRHMVEEVSARQAQTNAALIEAREAKIAAEAANRAKSDFLSRISHELRTPLNAILGFGQLLDMNELTDEQRECVDQISRGGKHLLGLINEILDIARIETGRMEFSPEPVRVADALEQALELVRPLGVPRDIQFRTDLSAANGDCVMADNQKLKQVLLNLLSNAVKYNRDQGEVCLSCEAAEPGRMRLVVSDTGAGIPSENLSRLFQPFDRLGAEQSGIEGSGLGLALSKSLVELMGGSLTVTSAVGKGSRFSVELPQVEAPIDEILEPPPKDAPVDKPVSAATRTVLYIEDNLDNLRLVQRILDRRPGIRLLTAMQGSLGMDLARRHRPDLILLDVHLPDQSGSQILRQLHGDPLTRVIPVVVVSADATARQIERLRAAGARDYLTKPIHVQRFLAIVDEVLKKGTSHDERAQSS